MRCSAYCQCKVCCGPKACGITASGKPVSANGGKFVAADKRIPFGTMLEIPGYADGQPVPVLDRGGAIKGNRLDLYFPTHQQARNWGVRYIDVIVYQ
jgi:3D (Asp-Asp-Asp) domain-containing protein